VKGISSSSESDDGYRDCGGKTRGTVGMDTGAEEPMERFREWRGNVGDTGEVWGVLRRTNVDMGVFAVRFDSDSASLSGRLATAFTAMEDDLRPIRGDEDI